MEKLNSDDFINIYEYAELIGYNIYYDIDKFDFNL